MLNLLEIWNSLNLIGTVLGIVGFILMLTQFRKKVTERLTNRAHSAIQKWMEEVNKNLDHPPEIPKEWDALVQKTDEKRLDILGILFVLSGLGFQFASILVESGLK